VFSDSLENGGTGWTHGGTGDQWQLGNPQSGPGVAYSGQNVWATGLNDPYGPDTYQWVRSPVIDLTGAQSARLNFEEFRDIETNGGDYTMVNIKDASDPENALLSQLVYETTSKGNWGLRSFPLPPEVLGHRIVVEFLFASDGLNTLPHSGWFIDDVSVWKN
jgi:bacillopeptidase F